MISDNEKFNMQVKPNSAFLAELKNKLPEFFDSEGNFDLDKFKGQLEEHNINELRDGYQLNFIGKDYARRQAGEMPSTVIVPDKKQNDGEGKDSQNLFFTGDNLEVLRHLQASYANKIDLIYIDPPYNTGSDGFVYPDKFEYSDEKLKEMFGMDDDAINRLKSIQGKASHSAWLTFMYPRLFLAKNLLSDDGIIFVSLDDNELYNIKQLFDEIFGEGQYVQTFVWQKKTQPSFLSKEVANVHEYVISYRKNKPLVLKGGLTDPNKNVELLNISNDKSKREFSKKSVIINNGKYTGVLSKGIYGNKELSIELLDDLKVKSGVPSSSFRMNGRFRWSQEKIDNVVKNGGIINIKSLTTLRPTVNKNSSGSSIKPPISLFSKKINSLPTNTDATTEIKGYFDGISMFTNPKPSKLIKYLIELRTYDSKEAIILDFFAGSSTTADSVMQLNAEDGGHRKFIMVQLPEPTFTTNSDGKEVPTKGGEAAYKAGFKSIDEISRERIRRASEKIKEDAGLTLPGNFDGSFKHYRVVSPTKQALESIEDFDPNNTSLFTDMVESFSSKKLEVSGNATGEETILTTWLAKDGYSFEVDIKKVDFAGYEASLVEDSRLYIIKDGWTSENTKDLLNKVGTHQLTVQTIVLFGYSFNIAELRELENGLNQLDVRINLLKRY